MDKNISTSLLTVLMPVYNSAPFLRETMNSVLNQTFRNFIFLIIDDASTDESVKIIESFKDERIQLIKNETNLKLIATLNKGLEICKTKYICRMDSDDVCLPDRFKMQVEYMETHSEVGASGSAINLMKGNKLLEMKVPAKLHQISAFMLFNSPMAHPSVILRKSVLDQLELKYNKEYIHAEDYKLWCDISMHAKIGNINNVLLNYRVHENQITSNPKNKTEKEITLKKIRCEQLNAFNINYSDEELQLHQIIADGLKPEDLKNLEEGFEWLIKLHNHNLKTGKFDSNSFNAILHERAIRLGINTLGLKKGFIFYIKSRFRKEVKMNFTTKFDLYWEFRTLFKRYLKR
jgi:glycosyltransferase involved in cell wall biosynthesis